MNCIDSIYYTLEDTILNGDIGVENELYCTKMKKNTI